MAQTVNSNPNLPGEKSFNSTKVNKYYAEQDKDNSEVLQPSL